MRTVSQIFRDLYAVHHKGGSRFEYKIICGKGQSHFLPSPNILPNGEVLDCCFNSTYTRMVVITDTSPYMAIYDTTVLPYAKLANPIVLPTGRPNSCQYRQDNNMLVITHANSPYVTLYDVKADINNKLNIPSADYECVAAEFQSDRLYVSQIITNEPIIAYDLTTFDRIDNKLRTIVTPKSPPTSEVLDCCFNESYTRLTVVTKEYPYIAIYDTTTIPYTKIANPNELPTGRPNTCHYNGTGNLLVVTHAKAPYFTLYNVELDNNVKIPMQQADYECVSAEFQNDRLYLAQTLAEKKIIAYNLDIYTRVDEPIPEILWKDNVGYDINALKDILCVSTGNEKPYIALYSGVSGRFEKTPKILWKNAVAYNINEGQNILCVGSPEAPYIILYEDTETTVTMDSLYGALNFVDGISDNYSFSVGNAYMGTFSFSMNIAQNKLPLLSREVLVYMRLVSQYKQSEWVLFGTYEDVKNEYDYTKKRVKISCTDNMSLLNNIDFELPATETFTFLNVIQQIQTKTGLTVRNFPQTANNLIIEKSSITAALTLRQMLSYLLIIIGANAKASGKNIDIYQVKSYPYSKAISQAIDGKLTMIDTDYIKISAVKLTGKNNTVFNAGTSTYKTYEATIPFATQEHADYMLSVINGYINKPVAILDSYVSPEFEAGDIVQSQYTGENFLISNVSGAIHAAYKIDLEQGTLRLKS